jgi:hypothetical protein
MNTVELPQFDAHFDGDTYDPALDKDRLKKQLGRVYIALSDGAWHTLEGLYDYCIALRQHTGQGGADSVPGISARIRDLRKWKFGNYEVLHRRLAGGLWEYKLTGDRNGLPENWEGKDGQVR